MMNKLIISILLSTAFGLSGSAAQANDGTPAAIAPIVSLGPGPVINLANSLNMEEKKAAMVKQIQQYQAKQIEPRSKKNKRHKQKPN
ncbi:hypothetical protein AAY84_04230 [Serratia marcescens]|uniref:hypothetical protein n=1 Tax=Serratia TaxID=613 RepID=UPI00062C47C5|nr:MULTISPECIES: hypothetical protein [Serratia]KKZ19055.1 hypothetical protein AAY84_04230 [Serratia marcescens]MBH2927909.1 hypothetical protein [Serratia ureilytica]